MHPVVYVLRNVSLSGGTMCPPLYRLGNPEGDAPSSMYTSLRIARIGTYWYVNPWGHGHAKSFGRSTPYPAMLPTPLRLRGCRLHPPYQPQPRSRYPFIPFMSSIAFVPFVPVCFLYLVYHLHSLCPSCPMRPFFFLSPVSPLYAIPL